MSHQAPELSAADTAYASACAAVCAGSDPTEALRRAVAADPTHAVALADLRAWTGKDIEDSTVGATAWARHHLEIVRTAATDPPRAEALLRDHTAHSGCDPLALLIVTRHLDGMDGQRLSDLRGHACSCWT
jgi:hypothetical protein